MSWLSSQKVDSHQASVILECSAKLSIVVRALGQAINGNQYIDRKVFLDFALDYGRCKLVIDFKIKLWSSKKEIWDVG